MKNPAKYFALALIWPLWLCATGSAISQKTAPEQHPAYVVESPGQATESQKVEFLRMLEALPHDAEFYTDEGVEKAGPYLPLLLALTEKDTEHYDLYKLMAISRGLCDYQEHRRYVVRHFKEIGHAELKLAWAAMIFDANDASPEMVQFLQAVLKSPNESRILSEMIGPDFEDFKKRVLSSPVGKQQ